MNVVVYVFTTNHLLVIKPSVIADYGFVLGTHPLVNFITAAFLHADPFPLIGNMLFLWLFAPSVEDRPGIPVFLVLYLAAGLAGALC